MKKDWPTYPAYGSEMLQLGIRAGNRIYKSVDMPTMGFKVDRLISIISSSI